MPSRLSPTPSGSDPLAERKRAFGLRRAAEGRVADEEAPGATFPIGAVAAAAAVAGLVTYLAANDGFLAGPSALPPWLALPFLFVGLFGLVFVFLRMASPLDRDRSSTGDSGSGGWGRDPCGDGDGDGGDGGGDGGGD